MARTNFVCTMCPQTFTRRWRGNTHNTNLHSGGGRIVRFVDYIIGRLDGQYFAGDPTLYRRKISNVLSHEGIFDLERVFETNKEKSAMRNQEKEEVNRIAEHIEDFSQFQSATHPRIQQN